jgi:hypothetical protein
MQALDEQMVGSVEDWRFFRNFVISPSWLILLSGITAARVIQK